MQQLSLKEFSQQLSNKVPVPGGGGAAALSGALGAALGHMAAVFTSGKKRFAAHESIISDQMRILEEQRIRLLNGIQEDADAFLLLCAAYSMPTGCEAERAAKDEAVQRALIAAIDAPMKTLCRCADIVSALAILQPITSPVVKSDIGCAACLCRACMEAALLNVLINTGSLKDKPKAHQREQEAIRICQEGVADCQIIYEAVKQSLCSED